MVFWLLLGMAIGSGRGRPRPARVAISRAFDPRLAAALGLTLALVAALLLAAAWQ